MPGWFAILKQVLALVAYLVPMIEQTFGNAPGQGAEKKAAVMARVAEYVDAPPTVELCPDLTPEGRESLLGLASAAADAMVGHANILGLFETHSEGGAGPESSQEPRSRPRRGVR